MLGFNPLGSLPLGATPLVDFTNSSHTLTIMQTATTGVFETRSHQLIITGNVTVDVHKNIAQTLVISQDNTANVNKRFDISQPQSIIIGQAVTQDNVIPLSQSILILQSNNSTQHRTLPISHTLGLVQNNLANINYAVAISQSLTFAQTVKTDNPIAINQSLSLSQSDVANVLINNNHALLISQSVTVNVNYLTPCSQYVGIGSNVIGATKDSIEHGLLFVQTTDSRTPHNFTNVHTLAFTQQLQYQGASEGDHVLNITQQISPQLDWTCPISQSLTFGQLTAINKGTISDPANQHNLVLHQVIDVVTPIKLAVSQSIAISHSHVYVGGTHPTQTLAFTQQTIADKFVNGSWTHNLTFTQNVVFSRAETISQSLSLSQTALGQAPNNIDINQSLTLADTLQLAQSLTTLQALTIGHSNDVINEVACVIQDILNIEDSQDVDDVYSFKNIMSIVQQNQFAYDLAVAQSLTMSQAINGSQNLTVTQSLSLSHANSQLMAYSPNTLHNLLLSQMIDPDNNYVISNNQTLSFSQNSQINSAYYLMLCDCLKLHDRVTNYIPLSASNHLTFTWTELEVYYHKLLLVQTIQTNMDDADCCRPFGFNGNFDPDGNLTISQAVGCGCDYNITIEHDLVIDDANGWRKS